MTFMTWILAIPTTIVLFFFPVVPQPQEQVQTVISAPQVQVIAIPTQTPSTTKDTVISALHNANIEVTDITPVLPPKPTTIPVGGEVASPAPEPISTPEEPQAAPELTSIDVQNISTRPFYSGCNPASYTPMAKFQVTAQDQNGGPLDETISYSGSDGRTGTVKSGNFFWYSPITSDPQKITIEFSAGKVSTSTQYRIVKVPDEHPAWCD